ncbi:MAG: DUF3667 domain-containing protein [Hyphomonadaceae bacterium]|nr:DUF3667 domain-containing protein [Hyphomonadaceae bacterium]
MTGEAEAAGALATAGLIAGAIEGREGGLPSNGACLNCGAPVTGRFCANCGQHAQPIRSLRHVAGEFVHNLFHFDTKAWRTLPMVVFRPGTLTRDYVFGKRARYISPLATFLLCVFLLFFVFSVTGGADFGPDVNVNNNAAVTQDDLDEARAELAEAQAALAEARRNPPADEPEGLAEGLASGAVEIAQAQVDRIEAQLAAQAEEAAAAAAETEGEASPDEAATTPAPAESAAEAEPEAASGPFVGVQVGDEETARAIESGEGRWQDELREAVDRGDVNVNLGHPYLNERAIATLRNPDLALYRIQEAASKFSFLLAPLSLPFIALLFLWKRGVTFYDHVVYALYALSFASILFMVLMVGAGVFGSNIAAMAILSNVLLLVALPVHTFFHLKGAYALGWWSALWRTFFMLIFAILIATIFLVIILILGLAG